MVLKRLSILNYKNIAQADLELSPGINCLIGHNGEGKTNLLDAIYFLSMCKSANSNIDSACIRHNEEFMMLQGDYEREDGTPEDIQCGLKIGQKKVMRRGKKAYKRLAEHIGQDQDRHDRDTEVDQKISDLDTVRVLIIQYNSLLFCEASRGLWEAGSPKANAEGSYNYFSKACNYPDLVSRFALLKQSLTLLRRELPLPKGAKNHS